MRLRLYSIFDRLMGVYLAPFVARADVEAYRQVAASLADPQLAKSPMATNPRDYELRYVSTFDDESGECFPESRPAGNSLGSLDSIARRLSALGGSDAEPLVQS